MSFVKKSIILFIVINLLLSSSYTVFAENVSRDNYFLQYNGTAYVEGTSYRPNCTFTVNSVSNNNFKGNFRATNLGGYEVNQNVEGSVFYDYISLTCVFSLTSYYHTSLVITIYPYEGYCECITHGDWHFARFTMTGTTLPHTNIPSITSPYYDEDLMKLCMAFSAGAYCDASTRMTPKEIINIANKNNFISLGLIKSNDHKNRHEKHKISYTILPNFKQNNVVDLYVILRGTTNDEWQGNMEITGTTYQELSQHKSFLSGSVFLDGEVQNYLKNNLSSYNGKTINLIITGHSRGAAVANLYAKKMSDNRLFQFSNETLTLNTVVGYTFATPNVEKYNGSMTNYNNIFNFCFFEDFVPTIPLTVPTSGWDYWKYGCTYWLSIVDVMGNRLENNFIQNKKIKKNNVKELLSCMTKWDSVEKYYNERCYDRQNNFYTTAYNYFHDALAKVMMPGVQNRVMGALNIYSSFKQYHDFVSLSIKAVDNISTIATAHQPETYNALIENYGSMYFEPCSYINYKSVFENSNRSMGRNVASIRITYDYTETLLLTSFYNQANNSNHLDWDISDPSTWSGITWNSSGHATAIDLEYLDLEGTLDLSHFSELESVNVSGNKLTSIDLTDCDTLLNLNVSSNNLASLDVIDCTDLEVLDCSFNDLSTGGLDVSENTALKSLICDDCGLATLVVNTLPDLEELSCSFNRLTMINVDNNTELNSLVCCCNYLDTHKGGALYTKFNTLLFNEVYVNYYPQAVPDNATFNTNELNALKSFALLENNNNVLDWLDENNNIDTDKLQNNVLFEYDGSKYRVVAIDIADADVEGALNLTSLAKLQELYCDNTGITSLNVNGCTVLSTLNCDNCEIATLSLPSNAGDEDTPLYYLSCEYNHINTSIFTSNMVQYITFKAGATLEYENQKYEDSSALEAALEFAGTLRSSDYSEESFSALRELVEEYSDFENMLLTQDDVDEMTAEILIAISDLVPYLKLRTVYENGTVSITKDGQPVSTKYTSALSGTPITLTATPEEGYIFNGWYELTAKRIFSTSSTYSFNLTTNLSFEAQFVPTGSATLTFTNDTGQIVDKVTKTAQEWANTTSLSDLLPEVPYKLGHTGGQWTYVESDILTALSNGTDSYISPTYSASEFVYPEIPTPVNNKPVSNLTFSYNETDDIGSFIMASGIPQDLDIEAIGVAFYKGKKETFNPDSYILNINNKSLVSRFDGRESDGLYIVNVHSFSVKNNWCARGFITYRDGNELKTHYTNQINVTNTVQNNQRRVISRSRIIDDNSDSNNGIDADVDYEPL